MKVKMKYIIAVIKYVWNIWQVEPAIDFDTKNNSVTLITFNTGAYLAEVVRGGINSVDEGQFEACKALGMTHSQTMFNVVIPQTIKSILPAIAK